MKPANKALHIFKKDAKLLWPFVLGVAGIHLTSAAVLYARDHLPQARTLMNLSNLLLISTILASSLLIAMAVHEDAIPGVRQDWLARPIRRADLLLAKVIFALLMVHGPMLLADTVQALANGFPLGQSLAAAGSRGLYLLVGLTLPVLAFASMTRNMAEAVIGAVLVVLGFAVLQILFNLGNKRGPLRGTGLFWVAEATMFLTALAGSIAILALQYFRRKTTLARWAMIGVALLLLSGYFVPWDPAFALEQRLSPNPGVGSAVTLAFTPAFGKFRLPEGMTRKRVPGSPGTAGRITRNEASSVYLPLQITGLPDVIVLNADRAEAFLSGSDGAVVYRGPADDLLVRTEGLNEPAHFTIGLRRLGMLRDIRPEDRVLPEQWQPNGGDRIVYQGLFVPTNLYEHIKDRLLRLEIRYSFTLLQGRTYSLPAIGGDLRMPGVGRCRTQMDPEGDDIEIRCIQAGATPTCTSGFLEDSRTGKRNPAMFSCWPNYSPYFGQYLPDAMIRFGASLRFRDEAGLTRYPVDSAQLPESRVVIRLYEPQDHFTRQLIIPQIRLSDWESLEHESVAPVH